METTDIVAGIEKSQIRIENDSRRIERFQIFQIGLESFSILIKE